MIERQVEIVTSAGRMDTFVTHPERDGPFPVIFFYMDAPGIREELRDMARRLASVGYVVVLPNLYYRAGTGTTLDQSTVRDEGGPERERMWQLMYSLTNALVMDDTRALFDFIDEQPYARTARIGCVGYCMSGQFVFTAAAEFPDRIAAMASLYGVGLVTDRPDSPHLRADRIAAEMYFGCAEVDSYAPPEVVVELERTLAATSAVFEVERYPGTEHGFAFPKRPVYDKAAAERHWERLFSLFRRCLD
ncbi:MAG TPA: dienelactone hydrolase family protein [Candidatus Baltobacteraceae bacterium]|nr:dienelactone hydrolase family protein [Candidatus Baltobacteraceae bacterium]